MNYNFIIMDSTLKTLKIQAYLLIVCFQLHKDLSRLFLDLFSVCLPLTHAIPSIFLTNITTIHQGPYGKSHALASTYTYYYLQEIDSRSIVCIFIIIHICLYFTLLIHTHSIINAYKACYKVKIY